MVGWAEARGLGRQTLSEIKADNVGLLASAVAFRIFLSIFPTLIAVVAIFSVVTQPEDLSRLLDQARGVLPDEAYALLSRTLQRLVEQAAGGFAIAGVLGGLWAAGSAATVLIKALNMAYDVPESRGFVRQRLVALLLTGVLLLAIVSLLALLVLGGFLQSWLVPPSLEGTAVDWLLVVARLAASVILLMLLVAIVYWIGPNRDPHRWNWITPGAIVAVLAWIALSGLFALYTRTFASYDATYGSLGSAVVTMLWLQLTMMTLLVGAELNQVWERRRRGQTAGVGSRSTVVPPD